MSKLDFSFTLKKYLRHNLSGNTIEVPYDSPEGDICNIITSQLGNDSWLSKRWSSVSSNADEVYVVNNDNELEYIALRWEVVV